jgi:hypothetical protein
MQVVTNPEFIGNSYVFYSFRVISCIQVLISLGNIIAGILISLSSNSLDWFNLCYILTGTILLLLSIFSYSTYDSISNLICYLIILFTCFASELGFTLGILILSKYNQYIDPTYAEIAEYSMIGASFVLFLGFLLGCWYLYTIINYYIEKEKLLNKH